MGLFRRSFVQTSLDTDIFQKPSLSRFWPFGELVQPAFVVWLYGRTGTLKSSLAALVLNHFGPDFDGFHFPASFLDTPGRLEQKAFLVKDAVLVVDDYAPQKDARAAQEYRRAAHHLVPSVGNRAGRGRLTRDIKARQSYAPRGLVMVTGEELPETESLVARLFVVELKGDSVDLPRLTAAQARRELYSHAMAGYLGWLKEHWSAYIKLIPERALHYRGLASNNGAHLRLPETIALLMVGWEMGLRYALSIGALPATDYALLMDLGWQALVENGAEMAQLGGEEKPEELFLGTFRELLAQGKVYLCQRDGPGLIGGGRGAPGSEERGEMLGWYDEACLYLLPEVSYTRIARHFRDQGGVFPARPLTFRKSLKEAGYLLEQNGRLSSNILFDGRGQRVLVLKRNVLGEI